MFFDFEDSMLLFRTFQNSSFWFIVIAAVLMAFLFLFLIWQRRLSFKKNVFASLKLQLLQIRVPKSREPKDAEKSIKEQIAIGKQVFSAFSKFKKPIILEIAVSNLSKAANFYIAVERQQTDFVEKQIEGLYPDSKVERVEDYNIFNPEGESKGIILKLSQNFALPIRTFMELESDPLNTIVNEMSKLEEVGEGIALQIVCVPAAKTVSKKITNIIQKMKEGKSFKEAAGIPIDAFLKASKDALMPSSDKNAHLSPQKPIDETIIKSLESKVSENLFDANIRIVSSAQNKERAEAIADNLLSAFSQLGSPLKNSFKPVVLRNQRKVFWNYSFRNFQAGESIVLNSEELASIWHLPLPASESGIVARLKAREAPSPLNLPKSGLVLGENIYRGERKLVAIERDDRRRHIYIIGQTGTGKSVLVQEMARQDIERGEGVAVIDPHGELIENIISNIPEERFKDVIIFDPADTEYPLGLNMLEYDSRYPEQKTFISNEILAIFQKLYAAIPEALGPMFEQYMRNCLLLLMEDTRTMQTLLEVPRIFTDDDFRADKISVCKNPVIRNFWTKEAEKVGGEASLANITPYITSKFNPFIANDYIRPIIGQPHSAFNFRDIMDSGKILLINLSKGRLGDINANLLGMILVGKLLMAALSRVNIRQEERRDFYLYIDEFQNFTTDSIGIILSEARKYRLDLTVAHQFIAQLPDKIKDSVFGNVGSMAVFRVGIDDAEYFKKQFEPVFSATDLINLDNFAAYLKLMISGETSTPFNIKTFAPHIGNYKKLEILKEYSRIKYGRPRAEIEEGVRKRLEE